MKTISAAGNTIAPALRALEDLGYEVEIESVAGRQVCRAVKGDATFHADDPVAVLGLIKLVEARGWEWKLSDTDSHLILKRYALDSKLP